MDGLNLTTDKMLASIENGVGVMTYNQPEKRNAVSLEMWQAVEAAVTRFESDDSVRILILSGAGGKAFVSGANISKFESERASEEAAEGLAAFFEKRPASWAGGAG